MTSKRSGFAANQGRQVFVFPGQAGHKNYAGSHELIRDGATLVTNTNEILEDIGIQKSITAEIKSGDFSSDERTVIRAINDSGKALIVDRIAEITKLDLHVVSRTVAALTIQGIIKETESGYELSNS